MVNNKNYIIGMIISLIISIGITLLGSYDVLGNTKTPIEAYRVYISGESIGLIKSDVELYKYINNKQQALKDLYNVNNVYVPNDINVVRDVTYEENLYTVDKIYDLINKVSPFTIKGYIVTIDRTNTTEFVTDVQDESELKDNDTPKDKIIYINILDKEMFENSVKKTVLAFVNEEEYNNYVNETQDSIIGTGELIESLYIEDVVTIKEAYIPVDEKIYLSEEELTQYLIFGQNSKMSTYVVTGDDTIEDIANDNKMSVNELLIANPELRTSSALLYEGQKLTIGILDPVFTTVELKHIVEDQVIDYKTEYVYDNSKMTGYQEVQTPGSDGITRVTQKLQIINGTTAQALIATSEEIKPVVNEVIVKGGKKPAIITPGNWGWPTNVPYILASRYGWRYGSLHRGVDIGGTGYGSPIYAIQSGIIIGSGYNALSGYYVEIDHQNGYCSRYAHMASLSRYVKIGDKVNIGDTIGDMGNTGRSFGTHLHLEIWLGKPYGNNSQSFDPLLFY